MQPDQSPPHDFGAVLKRVEEERGRLGRLLPDIDPGDLHAILVAMLRPWGMGRSFFIRQIRPGVHVF